ncbi:MAG: MMPL family transporter [Gammaproteobacteria bacterium]|nr:MMPL family transporter [Gammaproteobacteria bacterium]
MRTRLNDFTTRYPRLILVAAAGLALLAGSRLLDFGTGELKLEIDSSLVGLLPTSGEELATYEQVRDRFGGDDILLVAWFSDALFTADKLRRLKRFTRRIERFDGVRRVDSLATALRVSEEDGAVRIDRFLHRIPTDPAVLDMLRAYAVANPVYRGRLVSPDGRGVLLAVHFDVALGSLELVELVARIGEASREESGDIEQFISGPVHARLEISRILFRDVRSTLPLAILATALVAALTLRSVRGVVFPLTATGLALLATLALFAQAGNALNFVTVIMPPVIFVVGFAFAVHVINEFDRMFTAGTDKKTAVTSAVDEVFVPLTLTAFTTAIGFASLATSPIASIKLFGIYTALGTVFGWLFALLVIPAGLLVGPVRVIDHSKTDFLTAFAPVLARFDIRHRDVILLVGAAIGIAAIAAASRLEVSTDYLSNFPEDSPVRRNFARIQTEFSGAVPIQVFIRSDLPGAFKDPAHLRTIEDLERWLEAQPEIGAATSLVDLIGVLHRAFDPDAPAGESIPPSRDGVEDLLFFANGDDLRRVADPRYESTLLHVRTSAVSTNDLGGLIRRIERRLEELPGHLRGEVTGSSALLSRTLDDIIRGQLTSLVGALAVIYVILILLFGSARIGALALFPNLLPIVCFFGLMSLIGVTLNLATSLVAAVALGIAVDDTMHFLSRFNTEARRVADEALGIERAMVSVIRPVTFTTLALCLGFATLTMGELRSQIEFGGLAAATLLVAWIVDLTFTPALSGRLRFVTLWEVLAVDLGTEPDKSIPFFFGLTHRQARIAAILGSFETFRAGEQILRLGDTGTDIHVVIDGELEASVPRDGNEQVLRRLKRGDLIGEVALFHGLRTANVHAQSDARLLRLSNACLDRIQARYPQIAAQLYRNLGVILADRLADVTERL